MCSMGHGHGLCTFSLVMARFVLIEERRAKPATVHVGCHWYFRYEQLGSLVLTGIFCSSFRGL